MPGKVSRQVEEFQRQLHSMAEAQAKIKAEFQRQLRPIAEAQAKIKADFQGHLREIGEARAKTEATMREIARGWNEAQDRILNEEAKRRGVSRGLALEWDLLVELRGWNHKTLRQVQGSHRRPGRRKAAVMDAAMFAEIDALTKNKRRSLTAAAKLVAAKRPGVGWRNLRDRYKAWLKTRP